MEELLALLGVRRLRDIAREIGEVEVIEYPEGTASPFKGIKGVRVVLGSPERGWRAPYLKVRGEGSFNFFGTPRGVLINGLAEAMVYVSGSKRGIRDELPNLTLRVFVYPGLPCYFVLREIGKLTQIKGLNVEVVSVDSDERYELLRRLGVNKVPTFELDGELLGVGKASAEEIYFLILKRLRARELSNSRKRGH